LSKEALSYLEQAAEANLGRNRAVRSGENPLPYEVEFTTCSEMYLSLGGTQDFMNEYLAERYFLTPEEEGGGASPE